MLGSRIGRKQARIDPPATLQQGWEERPGPQLRDPKLQICGRGRGDTGRGQLRCTPLRSELGLDQST
jgi:hypothetical protein